MTTRVYGWYSFVANPAVIALLFFGYLLCTAGFSARQRYLRGAEVPDVQGWFNKDELKALLHNMGPDHRPIYALTECTLDLCFPLIYASLFAGLYTWVFPSRAARWLLIIPVATMLCDLCENFQFAYLACHFDAYDKVIDTFYWSAVLSTAAKMGLGCLAILALGVGAVGRLSNAWSSAK